MYKLRISRGFTLIEILVVIAFVALLSTLTFQSFRAMNEKEVLEKDTQTVISLLFEARSLTLSSKNANQYGVHFETDKAVLFAGPTYDSDALDNKVLSLDRKVKITGIDLFGTGNEVVFDRLTGGTSQYGTTTISLSSDLSKIKEIIIFPSGLAEIR